MTLMGKSLIGFRAGKDQPLTLNAVNPATGEKLDPAYHSAGMDEVDQACELAAQAFGIYSQKFGRQKSAFLRQIARNIESIVETVVDRAIQETALPDKRLRMESGRTCNQFRMFADLIEEGNWVGACIDHADPNRKPLPKPDVRSMLRAMGPVAVFGASNFPLAYSAGGGDTASALAAGNPVVANAHYAHPGTCELIGRAIQEAVKKCDLPEGVYSLLFGAGHEVGQALVKHPRIKAVGYTGSYKGGRTLMDIAAARAEPIPVFAEMGSINPVFILPGAMKANGEQIAQGLHGSVTLGVGQFCTNPGLVLVRDDADTKRFADTLTALMSETPTGAMLTSGICSAYQQGIASFCSLPQVQILTPKQDNIADERLQVGAALMQTDAKTFLEHETLSQEVFGPATLLVTHSSREQVLDIAGKLQGQLTATIHGTDEELAEYQDLIRLLENKVGRLIFNGFPTGVEVCHAMVHGGPYPATADGRCTSVGSNAIGRFARLVCYQNFPDTALPDELKNDNPLGIRRLVDGHWNSS